MTYLNSSLTDIWEREAGKDITKEVNAFLASMPPLEAAKHNACLKNALLPRTTGLQAFPTLPSAELLPPGCVYHPGDNNSSEM